MANFKKLSTTLTINSKIKESHKDTVNRFKNAVLNTEVT